MIRGIVRVIEGSRRISRRFNVLLFGRKNEKVYVAGWIGSGSTFIYQVLNELGVRVKKVHGVPKFHSYDLTFFTIRDPRDIVISTARRVFFDTIEKEGLKPAVLKAIHHFHENNYAKDYYRGSRMPNLLFIRYETFFKGNEEKLIQFLADQVDRPVCIRRAENVLKKYSLEANRKRMANKKDFLCYDPQTQIHGRHISNEGNIGGWKNVFDMELAEIFDELLGELLLRLKYEESREWIRYL